MYLTFKSPTYFSECVLLYFKEKAWRGMWGGRKRSKFQAFHQCHCKRTPRPGPRISFCI